MKFQKILFVLTILFLVSQVAFSQEIQIDLRVYNNPKERQFLELPYKTIDFISEPQINIIFETSNKFLSKAKLSFAILDSNSKTVFSKDANLIFKEQFASFSQILESPLIDPKSAIFEIKFDSGEFKKSLPIELIKLSGIVTDFNGNPIPNAWVGILTDPLQLVRTDKIGFYQLQMPKANLHCLAAITSLYPFGQLENYVWNLPLFKETTQNFKVGQAEVFRIMADTMPQNRTISGTFVSWTCSGINSWANTKKTPKYKMDESLFEEKYFPNLKVEEVKFFFDDIEVSEIPLFQKCDVMFPRNKVVKNAGYRFEFHYPKNLAKKPFHELRIEVTSKTQKSDGSFLIEKGQGSLKNLLIFELEWLTER